MVGGLDKPSLTTHRFRCPCLGLSGAGRLHPRQSRGTPALWAAPPILNLVSPHMKKLPN